MLQQVIQTLSNYFLTPLGLAALTAIIPLIIFYLMRPSPEEKIMPSMAFFHKDKKSGRFQKALKILQRNTMLLLHILMISGIAAAIANPYIMKEQRPENAVIVIDNSASMKPAFGEVKQRSISQLGQKNTVILANDESEIIMQQASFSRAREFIRGIELEETGTDIAGAVRKTSGYEGKIFIASDFDHSGSGDVSSALESISARPLEVYNPEKSNSWGMVGLELFRDNATVLIQNYRSRSSQVRFKVGNGARNLEFDSNELKRVSFTLEEGKNTLKLEEDSFTTDNYAYIMKPSADPIRVSVIADERNRYLMKAFSLMKNVNATYVRPSGNIPESEVFVVGKTDSLTSLNWEKIRSQVKEGKGLVLYAQKDVQKVLEPVKSVGENYSTTVDVSRPVNLNIGNISIYRSQVSGESVSEPDEGLVYSEMGEGTAVYYNLASEKFRQGLMYPVFWKNLVQELSGKSSISEVNRKTGSEIITDSGSVEVSKTGFKTVSGTTYALNLLSGDESGFEAFEVSQEGGSTVRKPQSIAEIPILAVFVLAMLELVYLGRKGEIP